MGNRDHAGGCGSAQLRRGIINLGRCRLDFLGDDSGGGGAFAFAVEILRFRQAECSPAAQQQGQQNRGGGQRSDRNGGNTWNGQAIGRGDNRFQGNDRRDDNRYRGADNRNDNRYGNNSRSQWNRGWADQRRLSSSNRGTYLRYRASPFRWPSGYGAQRWSLGQYLPSIFFSSTYSIFNYYDIGLPYPPPGTDWIRNGNDALLVDRYSGEIIDVVYDVFYW